MRARPRLARRLWIIPVVPVVVYAVLVPPSITWIAAWASLFVVFVAMVILRRPRGSDTERERGFVFDLDEITVVALALVADPVLVALVHGGTGLSTPTTRRYRMAYTVTMRALVGLCAALAGQSVLAVTVGTEPARYLLFVGAAAVAHLVFTVGSTLGVTFAIWIETGDLLDDWYAVTSADAALAGMAIPLGALGADLLERAPYGALLLGVVVVGAALVLTRLLTAEMAVRDEQRRREQLLGRLAELADAERRDVVRQVHDGPLQQLILTRMQLERLRATAAPTSEELDGVDAELGRSVSDLRAVLSGGESSLVIHGLGPAVESFVAEMVVADTTLVSLVDELPPGFGASGSGDDRGATVAFACVRELLNNAVKHSDALEVRVELEMSDDHLVATVVDDGLGFDPAAVLPERERAGHLGLPLVHERLEQIGGRIVIESRPHEGVRAACFVPLRPNAAVSRR